MNRLPTLRRAQILSMMAEGVSLRARSVEEVLALVQLPESSCRRIEKLMIAKALGENASSENRYEA
jgi:hypothetical protein